MAINCNWCALRTVVEYSEASMGRVAPAIPPALFRPPSASTMTQPGMLGAPVKLKPAKFNAD